MDSKRFQLPIAGLLIAIGLYLLGWTLSHALTEIKDRDRVVTVKGLAEKEVPADKVIWPLAFKEIGNDMISMYDELNRKNQIIVTFLKNNGITTCAVRSCTYDSAPKISGFSLLFCIISRPGYAVNSSPFRQMRGPFSVHIFSPAATCSCSRRFYAHKKAPVVVYSCYSQIYPQHVDNSVHNGG